VEEEIMVVIPVSPGWRDGRGIVVTGIGVLERLFPNMEAIMAPKDVLDWLAAGVGSELDAGAAGCIEAAEEDTGATETAGWEVDDS
jgi:hypothetical protein